jgi:hypothetical protein
MENHLDAVAKDMAMRKEATETKWIQMAGKPGIWVRTYYVWSTSPVSLVSLILLSVPTM